MHTSEKQVIYRDFKASNILLDGVSYIQYLRASPKIYRAATKIETKDPFHIQNTLGPYSNVVFKIFGPCKNFHCEKGSGQFPTPCAPSGPCTIDIPFRKVETTLESVITIFLLFFASPIMPRYRTLAWRKWVPQLVNHM